MLPTKDELFDVAKQVLADQRLHGWSVWMADAEPEWLINKVAADGSAANIRVHLHAGDGATAYILRFRVPAEELTTEVRRGALGRRLHEALRTALGETSAH